MSEELREYIKNKKQPMFPWTPDLQMECVSISEADRLNGSPKKGDMIAIAKISGGTPSAESDCWQTGGDK